MNQYIHIGAEVAAITALTIRFHKQIQKLEKRIEVLEKNFVSVPRVSLFEPTTPPAEKNHQQTDFFMSFFPMFSAERASDEKPSSVFIEELVTEDQDPDEIKNIFLKHLAFLADPSAYAP
jgi:hypothetical protein